MISPVDPLGAGQRVPVLGPPCWPRSCRKWTWDNLDDDVLPLSTPWLMSSNEINHFKVSASYELELEGQLQVHFGVFPPRTKFKQVDADVRFSFSTKFIVLGTKIFTKNLKLRVVNITQRLPTFPVRYLCYCC